MSYSDAVSRGHMQHLRDTYGCGAYPKCAASGWVGINTLREGVPNHSIAGAEPMDHKRPNHVITEAYRQGKT